MNQLLQNSLRSDLVHLIQNDKHIVVRILTKSAVGRHSLQNPSVVNSDLKILKAKLPQCEGGRQNQFNLRQIGGLSEYINIALHELAVPASLRPLRPPHVSHLQRLEGRGKLIGMIGIKAHQGYREIVTKTPVHQILFFPGRLQVQLFAPLQNLEDQLFVFPALLAAQIFYILHTGSFDGCKPELPVSLLDHTAHIIPDRHLLRENILHTGNRFLTKCHFSTPVFDLYFYPFVTYAVILHFFPV